MKKYWTSGVMIEISNPKPGDKLYYACADVDAREEQWIAIDRAQKARLAELDARVRELEAQRHER